MPIVDAVALPDECDPSALTGVHAVVIDVLRASSTIVAALGAGAKGVVPVRSVEQAFDYARENQGVLLGGERSAVRVEGFDLGNSPLEYREETLGGRVVVLSTTNGTRAIEIVRPASSVYIGAITNRAALCRALMESTRDVCLVCSGTDGEISDEDCFGAGLIADTLAGWGTLTAGASAMRDKSQRHLEQMDDPAQVIASSFHGKRLYDLGLAADIEACGKLDSSEIVPMMNDAGMLVAAG